MTAMEMNMLGRGHGGRSKRLQAHQQRGRQLGEPATIVRAPAAKSPAPVSAAAPVPKATPAANRFTQADIDQAVAKARDEERARVAMVFAAPGSHGRERVCATLLSSPKGFSGSLIVAELAQMPTDREQGGVARNDVAAAGDDPWERIYATAAQPETREHPGGGDVWTRAYGTSPRPTAEQSDAANGRTTQDSADVWARAYGSN